MALTAIQLISKLFNFLNIWDGLLILILTLIFHLLSKREQYLLNLYYLRILNILPSKNKLDIIIFYFSINSPPLTTHVCLTGNIFHPDLTKFQKAKFPCGLPFWKTKQQAMHMNVLFTHTSIYRKLTTTAILLDTSLNILNLGSLLYLIIK